MDYGGWFVGSYVGEHSRDNDLTVNVTKGKQMTKPL